MANNLGGCAVPDAARSVINGIFSGVLDEIGFEVGFMAPINAASIEIIPLFIFSLLNLQFTRQKK